MHSIVHQQISNKIRGIQDSFMAVGIKGFGVEPTEKPMQQKLPKEKKALALLGWYQNTRGTNARDTLESAGKEPKVTGLVSKFPRSKSNQKPMGPTPQQPTEHKVSTANIPVRDTTAGLQRVY